MIKPFIVFLLVVTLTIVPLVHGFGITPSRLGVDFEANKQQTITFIVIDSLSTDDYTVVMEGFLKDYSSIVNKRMENGQSKFDLSISFPAKLKRGGAYISYVKVFQKTDESGDTVGTAIGVVGVINTKVPYTGIYGEASLRIADVLVGSDIKLDLEVSNLGQETFSAKGSIEISTQDGEKLSTITTAEKTVESGKSINFKESIVQDKRFKQGKYKAKAVVHYSDKEAVSESEFRVGEDSISITEFTSQAFAQQINPIAISIKSESNSEIKDVVGELKITKKGSLIETLKSPTENLAGFESKNLTVYWNTKDLKEDEYDAEVTVFFNEKTSKKTGKIMLSEKQSEPVKSEPLATGKAPDMAMLMMLGVVGVILLVAIVVFFKFKLKTKKPKAAEEDNEKENDSAEVSKKKVKKKKRPSKNNKARTDL